MTKRVERPAVRSGYDTWSETYDATPNPVVALDRRHTMRRLGARPLERVLDAGCGTGRHLRDLVAARSRPVGLDFSLGMLRVARRRLPAVDLAQADLSAPLPVRPGSFDAALSALVGEHLGDLALHFRELFACLRTEGRLVFSVFHPEMAAAGIEANFESGGVEYRLGAHRHTLDDYLGAIEDAGFERLEVAEHAGDEELAREIPSGRKYLGRPVLVVIEGRKR
ncbi:MAG TPA: class I SAM-dependent methyltransferase [Planctomycetota bacterium]|nr:class I SAM-dependent methyltransferase [Planctomycetota bacterium]